jgi:hypothetical protein
MAGPDGLPYTFRQASWDYGPRGMEPKGVVFHMAEGADAAEYLMQRKGEAPRAKRVLRGVSATFCVQPDGTVIQELPMGHVSGSLNPNDVRDDNEKVWGKRFTRYLGPSVYTGSANRLTISIETSGFSGRKWTADGQTYPPGPNPAQVKAIIELVELLRRRYGPKLGFNGHADFADYKPCPGTSAGVRKLFATLGHGRGKPGQPDPGPTANDCEPIRKRLRKAKERLAATEEDLEAARQALEAAQAGEAEAKELVLALTQRLAGLETHEP